MAIPKIKTATSFRQSLYETLKDVAKGKTYVVTQKQSDPVVLISQEKYNRVLEEREVLKSIAAGVADLEARKTLTHANALSRLNKLKKKWK